MSSPLPSTTSNLPPPQLNPSQTVERIREIIVGRHIERLEARINNLETVGVNSPMPPHWEDRLFEGEARMEALQESVQRLARNSQEAETLTAQHREELQRLAQQIQQIAAEKAAENNHASLQNLEGKIGNWLSTWQSSLQTHLAEREQQLEERFNRIAAAARALADSASSATQLAANP